MGFQKSVNVTDITVANIYCSVILDDAKPTLTKFHSFQVPVRAESGVHPAGHHSPRHGPLHESRARVQRAPAQPVLQNWSVEYTVHTVNIQCILLSGHVGH